MKKANFIFVFTVKIEKKIIMKGGIECAFSALGLDRHPILLV